MSDGWRTWAALGLLVLGLSQMAGDLLGSRALRGLAAATTAAPAPKVFSAVRGLETYSTRFALEWTDRAGATRRLELTPEVYGRLRGPYNRRNVYGAALAYGPVLATDRAAQPMLEAIITRSLCGSRPLLAELGVNPADVAADVRVRYQLRPGSGIGQLPLTLAAPCP
jgi:hypothetical protein